MNHTAGFAAFQQQQDAKRAEPRKATKQQQHRVRVLHRQARWHSVSSTVQQPNGEMLVRGLDRSGQLDWAGWLDRRGKLQRSACLQPSDGTDLQVWRLALHTDQGSELAGVVATRQGAEDYVCGKGRPQ